jgi:hypothetical protein
VCTPTGLPVTFALGRPKLDEREVARDLRVRAGPAAPGQTILADKGYASKEFETNLTERCVTLARPATAGEHHRTTAPLLKPLRQLIESVNATLKTGATEDGPLVGHDQCPAASPRVDRRHLAQPQRPARGSCLPRRPRVTLWN